MQNDLTQLHGTGSPSNDRKTLCPIDVRVALCHSNHLCFIHPLPQSQFLFPNVYAPFIHVLTLFWLSMDSQNVINFNVIILHYDLLICTSRVKQVGIYEFFCLFIFYQRVPICRSSGNYHFPKCNVIGVPTNLSKLRLLHIIGRDAWCTLLDMEFCLIL